MNLHTSSDSRLLTNDVCYVWRSTRKAVSFRVLHPIQNACSYIPLYILHTAVCWVEIILEVFMVLMNLNDSDSKHVVKYFAFSFMTHTHLFEIPSTYEKKHIGTTVQRC